MNRYNCTATVELELRGRFCSVTAYGVGTYAPPSRTEPEEYDMEIVSLESDRGRILSDRVEALIDSNQWDHITESLWRYEGCE